MTQPTARAADNPAMHEIQSYELDGEIVWTVVAGGRDLRPAQPCRTPDELAEVIRQLAEQDAFDEATRRRLMREAADIAFRHID